MIELGRLSPQQAVRRATDTLRAADHEAPSFAARQIVCHALQTDTTGLLLRDAPLTEGEAGTLATLTQKILGGTPLWRAIGHRPFHGLDLALGVETLEPRDDTETLVEAALGCITDRTAPLRIADLGTGTGAVALALLSELPNAKAVLTDISADALEVTAHNAAANGFVDRIEIRQGDWLEPLEGHFDLIVSNPPYIASAVVDALGATVRDHDPRRALDGGEDGLDAYRIIFAEAGDYLAPGSHLAIEIGYDQRESVSALADAFGWRVVACHRDGGARDRAVILRR